MAAGMARVTEVEFSTVNVTLLQWPTPTQTRFDAFPDILPLSGTCSTVQ